MIVDCHTHIFKSVEQLGRGTGLWTGRSQGQRGVQASPRADETAHAAGTRPADKVFVLAFHSHYLDAHVPNEDVARYVARFPQRLVGFAGVDPTRPKEAIEELRRAHDELGLQGVNLWPAAQDFHPASSSAMRVYTEACRLRMPVMIHQDVEASGDTKMEYARPYLVDEIAREFPDLKIVVSQLGYPWTEEMIVLLGKHRNVFADISGLLHRQWMAYQALLSACQAGVMDSLLFGSNFPYATTAHSVETLYSLNQFCHGTPLPTIPREQLRQIVERDALRLLGIETDHVESPSEPDTTLIRTED
ncbi:MAG TPA: amidohydrolase family protein [Phycisphaerae bacterium]|nr:amidohydrolase family protein [Phycisphaerae bacterium]